MESKGFQVSVFNRTLSKVDAFVNGRGQGKNIVGCHSIQQFCSSLKTPRKCMLMVRAGDVVDIFINKLIPFLDEGDIIIDGGNSNWNDTNRRTKELELKKLLFLGCGVSGGEEGALKGPSIMPGGSRPAWDHSKLILQAISAKVEDGTPCCDWVGPAGAGHFVKMVHNGIEYGDMQLICEGYHILKGVLGLSNEELVEVFDEWNKGDMDSYLIEITRDIFAKKDEEDESTYVVDTILDTAGQKGTGKWTAQVALELGMPVTLIGEAVFARCLSALKEERVEASEVLGGPKTSWEGSPDHLILKLKDALYASKLVSYAQGFTLLRAAEKEYNWPLNYGGVALMWRGGCIIRSKFLAKIKEAFDTNADLSNLLLDPFFQGKIEEAQQGWRDIVVLAVQHGIPVPAISTALAYYDGLRTQRLPSNLLQAQRDYFGAHTYERIDKPRGEFFHTNWTGRGGSTASSTYNA
eukprot:CAMPEP_0174277780 /NCGR_PEP_ID=MMETSP0439-20130205/61118_1 /TAXON_ID=0 /ORGANISM="Stereomyxa ramosa, Strain Chinc5" /LENGTH=464 /DNA_ID=CAMNT_0015370129 /DNA_START=121 /DNA_END=1515 /DNA_ORIENTATION=+